MVMGQPKPERTGPLGMLFDMMYQDQKWETPEDKKNALRIFAHGVGGCMGILKSTNINRNAVIGALNVDVINFLLADQQNEEREQP